MVATSVLQKYRANSTDTGSTKVQVVLLTDRINELSAHLKEHPKDFDSRSGLLKMVGRRRRLLNYLSSTEPEVYQEFIKELGLRK